jgi:hypothetical protein
MVGTNDPFLSIANIVAFSKATDCSVMQAKAALLKMEPALRSRLFTAALAQPGKWGRLHDPIEDDPLFSHLIQAAAKAAEYSAGPAARRGHCHHIWGEQKRILAAQGITWHSPADMNPWTIYD